MSDVPTDTGSYHQTSASEALEIKDEAPRAVTGRSFTLTDDRMEAAEHLQAAWRQRLQSY